MLLVMVGSVGNAWYSGKKASGLDFPNLANQMLLPLFSNVVKEGVNGITLPVVYALPDYPISQNETQIMYSDEVVVNDFNDSLTCFAITAILHGMSELG
ncbi:MAG: hypothetical protein RIQ89_72 [Bacteroidota bacterium]